uniref:Uncharacterized protein n=1 Tax=viral metagenome TaxID=1070528 RepID=A0A2V0RA53_9ZZZZ
MSLGSFGNQLTIQGIARDLLKTGLNMTEAVKFVNAVIGYNQPNFNVLANAISVASKISDMISSFVGSKANCSMGFICYANDPGATIVNDIDGDVDLLVVRRTVRQSGNNGNGVGYPLTYTFNTVNGVRSLQITTNGEQTIGSFAGIGVTIRVSQNTAALVDSVNGLYLSVKSNLLVGGTRLGSGTFPAGTYSLFDSTDLGTTAQRRSVYITCPSVDLDRISNTCVIGFQISGDELFASAFAALIKEAIDGNDPNYIISVAGSAKASTYVPPAQAAVAALNGTVSAQTNALGIESVAPIAEAVGLDALGDFYSAAGNQLSADLSSVYDITVALADSLIPETGEALAGDTAAQLASTATGTLVAESFAEGTVAAGLTWLAEVEMVAGLVGTVAAVIV